MYIILCLLYYIKQKSYDEYEKISLLLITKGEGLACVYIKQFC